MTVTTVPNWNDIVATFEGQVVQILSNQLVSGLVLKGVLSADSIWLGPLGMVAGFLIGYGVKYGDWIGFMIADGWENTKDGQAYADSAYQLANLPANASASDRAKLEQAQKDAFDTLMGVKRNSVSPS